MPELQCDHREYIHSPNDLQPAQATMHALSQMDKAIAVPALIKKLRNAGSAFKNSHLQSGWRFWLEAIYVKCLSGYWHTFAVVGHKPLIGNELPSVAEGRHEVSE